MCKLKDDLEVITACRKAGMTITEMVEKWEGEVCYVTFWEFLHNHGLLDNDFDRDLNLPRINFTAFRHETPLDGTTYYVTKRGCPNYVFITADKYRELCEKAGVEA